MYFLDLFLVLYVKEEMGDWFYNACFKIQYTVEFFLQDRHIFVYTHLQILVTLTLILMSTIRQCLLMILRDISYTLLFPWHYKPHTYFLDITSHTLIFPGHYELHIVISLTFRWRLPWLVSSIPWMVSWIFTTLRMSRVCVRVCSNMPGTVRNHPCDALCHGATSLEGKIHLTCPFLSLGIEILMIEVRLGNIKMYFLITNVFTR